MEKDMFKPVPLFLNVSNRLLQRGERMGRRNPRSTAIGRSLQFTPTGRRPSAHQELEASVTRPVQIRRRLQTQIPETGIVRSSTESGQRLNRMRFGGGGRLHQVQRRHCSGETSLEEGYGGRKSERIRGRVNLERYHRGT